MPAKSKKQQRFMAMVHAAQKGELENPSKEVAEAAESMSKEDAKDFAETKHDNLPEKAEKVAGFLNGYKEAGFVSDFLAEKMYKNEMAQEARRQADLSTRITQARAKARRSRSPIRTVEDAVRRYLPYGQEPIKEGPSVIERLLQHHKDTVMDSMPETPLPYTTKPRLFPESRVYRGPIERKKYTPPSLAPGLKAHTQSIQDRAKDILPPLPDVQEILKKTWSKR